MAQSQHFVFVLINDYSHLAFSNAIEPLRIANLVSGQELYRWSLASENADPARASNGTRTLVDHGFDDVPACDRLFVLSGIGVRNHITRPLLTFLRRERVRGTPLGALCSAAYILARAGFLDDIPTAIHWEFHDSFMEEFPDIPLVRNVFVADAPILSASGGSATGDLMLHLIATAHDEELAQTVADQMVYSAVRESSVEQRVSVQARSGTRNPKLAAAIAIMRDAIEHPTATSQVAAQVGLSTRQLERLFGKYLHSSPKKYLLGLRLDRARNLLLQTEMSVAEISLACGFENPGHFARSYRTQFGISPTRQRSKLS